MIIAVIITTIARAMPTAVITESSEKTMSSARIWKTVATDPAGLRSASLASSSSADSSIRSYSSCVAL